jgi:hypothetical protein
MTSWSRRARAMQPPRSIVGCPRPDCRARNKSRGTHPLRSGPDRFGTTSLSFCFAGGRGGDLGIPAWPPCFPPISCRPSSSFVFFCRVEAGRGFKPKCRGMRELHEWLLGQRRAP